MVFPPTLCDLLLRSRQVRMIDIPAVLIGDLLVVNAQCRR